MKSQVHPFVWLALFPLLADAVGCNVKTATNVNTPTNTPQFFTPLALSCSCSDVRQVGDPIPMKVKISNLQPRQSGFDSLGTNDTFVVQLFRNGVRIKLTEFGELYQKTADAFNKGPIQGEHGPYDFDEMVQPMNPLSHIECGMDLRPLFDITSPGDYTVVIWRNVDLERGIVVGASTNFVIH